MNCEEAESIFIFYFLFWWFSMTFGQETHIYVHLLSRQEKPQDVRPGEN